MFSWFFLFAVIKDLESLYFQENTINLVTTPRSAVYHACPCIFMPSMHSPVKVATAQNDRTSQPQKTAFVQEKSIPHQQPQLSLPQRYRNQKRRHFSRYYRTSVSNTPFFKFLTLQKPKKEGCHTKNLTILNV